MTMKRMVLEIGMGTDIRGAEPTKAAVRALRDALWHNSLSVADALGLHVDAMHVEVTIGVPHPEQNPRSAISELANVESVPRVTTKSFKETPAKAMNGAPPAFWHMRQWQMLDPRGAASSR